MTAFDLLLGLGVEGRHDDAVGLEVARAFEHRPAPSVPVRAGVRDLSELVDVLASVQRLLVVDALRGPGPPGQVVRWSPTDSTLSPPRGVVSTHGLSFQEAYGIAREIGRVPDRLLLIGIEAEDLTMGTGLSPSVAAGFQTAVRWVEEALADRLPPEAPHA